MLIGLAAFLGKIWLNRILNTERVKSDKILKEVQSGLDATNQRLKSELDKGLYIHKVQFEKEFQIYEELWAELVELRKATLTLRPAFDMVNPKESEEDRKRKRLIRFSDSIGAFIDVTDKNRPFYSEDVYESMGNLWKLAHSESVQYKHSDPYSDSYWEKAQENRDTILTEIDKCCEMIRQRIGEVRVAD